MGLDIRTAEFLLHCRNVGVDFSNACTLGHQRVMLSPTECKRLSKWLPGIKPEGEEYADFFLRALGAKQLSAMDASRYENADIIHNLNLDLPAELHSRFGCLIDGGTLEHIFDFKQALKSCMQMVAQGGHLIICQMANNCMGHGFYQFSPELFYSALTAENGYEISVIALYENGVWYEPLSPSQVGERIQARTSAETFIFVAARRISDVVPFATPPHQSDYVSNLDVVGADGRAQNASTTQVGWPFALKRARKRLGDFKRKYIFTALPFIGELEDKFKEMRRYRPDRLENEKRFRKIGKRLQSSVSAMIYFFGTQVVVGVEGVTLLSFA